MGAQSRTPHLPAPTESPAFDKPPSLHKPDIDEVTDLSRLTDKTSYTIPDDGREIIVPTKSHRITRPQSKVESEASRFLHDSLVIEYFENDQKRSKPHGRPSIRVRLRPSEKSRNGIVENHLMVKGESAGRREPSYTKRIPLGPPPLSKSAAARADTKARSVSLSNSDKEMTRTERPESTIPTPPKDRAPVDIEVLAPSHSSDLSRSSIDRNDPRMNPSEISSMPPDSMLESSNPTQPSHEGLHHTNSQDHDVLSERSHSVVPSSIRSRKESESQSGSNGVRQPSSDAQHRSLSRDRLVEKAMEKLKSDKRRDSLASRPRSGVSDSPSQVLSRADEVSVGTKSSEDSIKMAKRLANERRDSESSRHRPRKDRRSMQADVHSATDSSLKGSKSRRKEGAATASDRSSHSDASRSSFSTNPRLLEAVEGAIRRLIIPELETLKQQQFRQRSRRKTGTVTDSDVSGEGQLPRYRPGRSSARDRSSRLGSALVEGLMNEQTYSPRDSIKSSASRIRTLSSSSENKFLRNGSQETISRDKKDHTQLVDKSSRQGREGHSRSARKSLGRDALTMAALSQHDKSQRDEEDSSTDREHERKHQREMKATTKIVASTPAADSRSHRILSVAGIDDSRTGKSSQDAVLDISHGRNGSDEGDVRNLRIRQERSPFEKYGVAPMPMQSEINGSDLTRPSILSEVTSGTMSPAFEIQEATLGQRAYEPAKEVMSPPVSIQQSHEKIGQQSESAWRRGATGNSGSHGLKALRHSNMSQHDLVQPGLKEQHHDSSKSRQPRPDLYSGGHALSNTLTSEELSRFDAGGRFFSFGREQNRALSPIQSVSSRQADDQINTIGIPDDHSHHSHPQSGASDASTITVPFDHRSRPQGIHLEPGSEVLAPYEQDRQEVDEDDETNGDDSVQAWLRAEHARNEVYRSEVSDGHASTSQDQQEGVSYASNHISSREYDPTEFRTKHQKHMTGLTDDSFDPSTYGRTDETQAEMQQQQQNVAARKNINHHSAVSNVESAVASLLDSSSISDPREMATRHAGSFDDTNAEYKSMGNDARQRQTNQPQAATSSHQVDNTQTEPFNRGDPAEVPVSIPNTASMIMSSNLSTVVPATSGPYLNRLLSDDRHRSHHNASPATSHTARDPKREALTDANLVSDAAQFSEREREQGQSPNDEMNFEKPRIVAHSTADICNTSHPTRSASESINSNKRRPTERTETQTVDREPFEGFGKDDSQGLESVKAPLAQGLLPSEHLNIKDDALQHYGSQELNVSRDPTQVQPAYARDSAPSIYHDRDEGYVSGPQGPDPSTSIIAFKDAVNFFDGDDDRHALSEFSSQQDMTPSLYAPATTPKANRLSTNSGPADGLGYPYYDAATGAGLDRIESKDIVALMDHLTVRDAQRNARDTEILVTLVRSAAEMRASFDQMKKFIAEQDDLVVDRNEKTVRDLVGTTKREIQRQTLFDKGAPVVRFNLPEDNDETRNAEKSRHPRDDDSPKPHEDDMPARRRSVFRRALKGLTFRNQNDLARVEQMLEQLLSEVDILKNLGASARGPRAQPSPGRTDVRAKELKSYYDRRAMKPAPSSDWSDDLNVFPDSVDEVTAQSTPTRGPVASRPSSFGNDPPPSFTRRESFSPGQVVNASKGPHLQYSGANLPQPYDNTMTFRSHGDIFSGSSMKPPRRTQDYTQRSKDSVTLSHPRVPHNSLEDNLGAAHHTPSTTTDPSPVYENSIYNSARAQGQSHIPGTSRWSKTTASSNGDHIRSSMATNSSRGVRDSLGDRQVRQHGIEGSGESKLGGDPSNRHSRSAKAMRSRSGDLQDFDYGEQIDSRGDDRLRSTESLTRDIATAGDDGTSLDPNDTTRLIVSPYDEHSHLSGDEIHRAETNRRASSPLIPSRSVSATPSSIQNPRYQAHRNSLNLQHPQPRQGPTERYRNVLEKGAEGYVIPRNSPSLRNSMASATTRESFRNSMMSNESRDCGVHEHRTSKIDAETPPPLPSPVRSLSPTSDTFGSAPTLARFAPKGVRRSMLPPARTNSSGSKPLEDRRFTIGPEFNRQTTQDLSRAGAMLPALDHGRRGRYPLGTKLSPISASEAGTLEDKALVPSLDTTQSQELGNVRSGKRTASASITTRDLDPLIPTQKSSQSAMAQFRGAKPSLRSGSASNSPTERIVTMKRPLVTSTRKPSGPRPISTSGTFAKVQS